MPLGGMGRTIAIWVVTTLPAVPPVRKQKSIAFSMLSPPQPAVTSGTPEYPCRKYAAEGENEKYEMKDEK